MSVCVLHKRVRGGREAEKEEREEQPLMRVLGLGLDFLQANGLGLHVGNYWFCKRVLEMVRAGLVPLPGVRVSLAGRDWRVAQGMALYLRRSRAWAQGLVVAELDMDLSGMRGIPATIAALCCELAHVQRGSITRFRFVPERTWLKSPPLCLEQVEHAVFDNRLRVTAAMFQCIGKMRGLRVLAVRGQIVVHHADAGVRDYREPHGNLTVAADRTTLVPWLPDTLEELSLRDSYIWAGFLFGDAVRARVAAGGFPALRVVCLAGLFRQMNGHDAHGTLLALQGVRTLAELELGVRAASASDGWEMRETHVAAHADFKAKRADVRVIC